MLPASLREELKEQIEKARAVWEKDQKDEISGVYIPGALGRKFSVAAKSFA